LDPVYKLLPSIQIFLDVESLTDLHALDKLVISSKAVLIFLTTGCLQRYFVRLEVTAAADNGVKMILVQETDDRHGHAAVEKHRSECPEAAKKTIFDSRHKEILWIRAAHYKLVSIKQIVQRMLVDDTAETLPELLLPGEITLQKVELPAVGSSEDAKATCHIWLPECAPWCSRLEACLQEGVPGLVVKRASPGSFATAQLSTQREMRARLIAGENNLEERPAHALLIPLNKHTLEDKGVQQDLSAVLRSGIQLVLLHIQEEEFGAVPFGRFFEQCPDNLRNAGLFDELACAWFFNEPHLSVSCKVVGMKLRNTTMLVAQQDIGVNFGARLKLKGAINTVIAVRRANEMHNTGPLSTAVHPISTAVYPIDSQDDQMEEIAEEEYCDAQLEEEVVRMDIVHEVSVSNIDERRSSATAVEDEDL
jgi:hypothetical protein